MVEQKAPQEIIESEQGEKFSYHLMTGILFLTVTAGSILENFQTYWQDTIAPEDFSTMQRFLSENGLNHIGDVTNGFVFGVLAIIGDMVLSSVDKNEKSEFVLFLKKITPFVLCTIMFALIIDAETVQLSARLPGFDKIMGWPNVKDIPAGFFGLLVGSVLYQNYYRAMKKK